VNDKIKSIIDYLGLTRLVILLFLVLLCIIMIPLKMPLAMLLSQTLTRFGMNGILVLAMVPGIVSGTGLNFALPLGIICGLLGGVISLELNATGFYGLLLAMGISIPFSLIVGYGYGLLINRVKGSEMMVSTYSGFSVVSLMCIAWLLLPFKNTELIWPIGNGLRTTITLTKYYDKILDNFLAIKIGELVIPTGLLLFFILFCLILWRFLRSRLGISMKVEGSNPAFAKASGINVDRMRMLGIIISTVLGAIGIIVFAQSYGFYQLYNAPLMMAFPAVAGVLIGGATPRKVTIFNVIIGTFLFQGLLTLALPVANNILKNGNLGEITRTIVSNGVILYALTKIGGGNNGEKEF